MRAIVIAAWGLVAVGCKFHPSSVPDNARDAEPPPDARRGPDSGVDAASPEIDAGPCPEEIFVGVTVNGQPAVPGGNPIEVLVGDTVSIRSTSCVRDEPGQLNWTLSPVDGTWETRQGTANVFSVYSIESDVTYVLTLEVSDADGDSDSITFEAFHTNGFQAVPGLAGADSDIRDLAAGNGLLWIATAQDAFTTPLASPGSFVDITSTWGGSSVPDGVDAIYFEEGLDRIWIGDEDASPVIYRGDVATQTFLPITIDTALGGTGDIYTIQPGPLVVGVRIGTSRGSTTSDPTGMLFGAPFVPALDPRVFGIAEGEAVTWGGGNALYDFADANVALYPFGGTGDQKIRNLMIDASGNLWIASDGSGVARADAVTGAALETFGTAQGLPHAKARNFTYETSGSAMGDVWVSTMGGIGRWKRDRGVMITVSSGDTSGILFTNVGGGRQIWGGTTSGLVYAHLP